MSKREDVERGKYVEPGRTWETLPKIRRMLQNKSQNPGQTAAIRSPSGPHLLPAAIQTNPPQHCERPVPPPPRSITAVHGTGHPRPISEQSHRTCSSPAVERCLRLGTEGFPLTPPCSQPVWLWERTPDRAATHGEEFQLNFSHWLPPSTPPPRSRCSYRGGLLQTRGGGRAACSGQPTSARTRTHRALPIRPPRRPRPVKRRGGGGAMREGPAEPLHPGPAHGRDLGQRACVPVCAAGLLPCYGCRKSKGVALR